MISIKVANANRREVLGIFLIENCLSGQCSKVGRHRCAYEAGDYKKLTGVPFK
jgi:hypothetical protein